MCDKALTETSRGRKNTEERQMGPDEREVEMERIEIGRASCRERV